MAEPPVYDERHLERTLRVAFEDPDVFMVPKGIVRFDYGSTHAWRVSITRDKAKFEEYFFDGASGSIENALRRAILYRHEVLAAFPMTVEVRVGRYLDPDPEKRISRHVEPGKITPYIYWRATWNDQNHNRKTRNFPVRKLGEAEARRLALEATQTLHNSKPKLRVQPDPHAEERWRPFSRADLEEKASHNEYHTKRSHPDPAVNDSYPFAHEGARHVILHMSIERDRALRNAKIALFLAEHGRLFCEACRMNFRELYSFLERDIIEVHHIMPLSQLTSSTVVDVRDLILLCSNCHTVVHQGDAAANLPLVIGAFRVASAQ